MSFRPTIAVYYNGKIADIGYYRNWDEMDLLGEAMAIAVAARECGTLEEYRDKVFGRQTVCYSISPESWENTPGNLKRLEKCSEMPIVVDMTARAVYVSCGAVSKKRLRKIPEANGWDDFAGETSKILLTDEVMDNMEKLIREDPEVRSRLSGDTLRALDLGRGE